MAIEMTAALAAIDVDTGSQMMWILARRASLAVTKEALSGCQR